MAERAEHGVERIAKTTRAVMAEARRNLTKIHTPQQFHDLVEEIVGQMVVQRDGTITRRDEDEERPGSEDDSKPDGPYVVAGAGFDTDSPEALEWEVIDLPEPSLACA